MAKPDCYKCIFRRQLIGDRHSSCAHPPFDRLVESPILSILATMASARKESLVSYDTLDMNLQINPHGKKMGWANHPWNFDPIWIDSCDGFTSKDDQENTITNAP